MTLRTYHEAIARERFERQTRKALIQDLLGRLAGKDTDLLSYEEVARRLRARSESQRKLEFVPLDKIVGSVGRYRDFTREFLPRDSVNKERWARLDAALNAMETIPPVELYKIGDVYFVKDGNHRVSVARANGLDAIEAYVTEIEAPVDLDLDDFERDRWIIKAEEAEFLRKTRLNEIRPEANIQVTEPGGYPTILNHIEVHGYLRNQELAREGRPERLSWEEIVASWYDNVYRPLVEAMRKHDLLSHFPGRTEADLYLWLARHREELAARYGLAPLSPEATVATFAEVHSAKPLERTLKGVRLGLHRVLGDEKPLGLSDEEFRELRARHEAGEITLLEAEQRHRTQNGADGQDADEATQDD